jgi:hypothetical protein
MSTLDTIIPAEITGDSLSNWLEKLAATDGVNDIVEVGGSDGTGSTSALIRGAMKNPRTNLMPVRIDTLEISLPRFQKLDHFCNSQTVLARAHRMCSTPISSWMTETQVRTFHAAHPELGVGKRDVEEVVGWLHADVAYSQDGRLIQNALEFLKETRKVNHWSIALLDGGAFSGMSDLKSVWGSEYLVLDDICDIKFYDGNEILKKSWDYELIVENKILRNGFSIWKHT